MLRGPPRQSSFALVGPSVGVSVKEFGERDGVLPAWRLLRFMVLARHRYNLTTLLSTKTVNSTIGTLLSCSQQASQEAGVQFYIHVLTSYPRSACSLCSMHERACMPSMQGTVTVSPPLKLDVFPPQTLRYFVSIRQQECT